VPDLISTAGSATANSRPWMVKPRLELNCLTCGTAISRLPSQHRASGAFCGRACYAESLKAKSPTNKGKKSHVARLCLNCGGWMTGAPFQMAYRRLCSVECKGEYQRGAFSSQWRGGVTPRRMALLNQPEYKAWRVAVRTRDRGRCRWCDSEGKRNYTRLETHHIIPVSVAWDSATDVRNGITLCRTHHLQVNQRESDYATFFASLIDAPLVAPPSNARLRRSA
jgi:hypothetical protein